MKKSFFPPIPVYPSRVRTTPWIYANTYEELDLLDEEQRGSDDSLDGSVQGESKNSTNEKPSKTGKWLLFLDCMRVCEVRGMTQLDYAWQFVKQLVETGVLYSAKCSTAWNRGCEDSAQGSTDGVIYCYTKDYSDKQDVKKAADAIRKVYNYPRGMYYETDIVTYVGKYRNKGDKFAPIYKHTIANEMLDIVDDIVEYKCSPTDPVYPSRVTTEPWVYARRCQELHLLDEEQSESDDSFDGSADGESAHCEEEKLSKTGKWLLFLDNMRVCQARGMTELDYAWQSVKRLVETGLLINAKCSTSWNGENEGAAQGSTDGVICCYTKDYSDKRDVKKAADAIRKVYYYPRHMFYKTDIDTYAGKYRIKGDKFISIYKHTTANEMYERDAMVEYKWRLIENV